MRFFNTAGPVDCEGRTEREYGLGRMRTDLLVIWPYPSGVQKVVIELKVLHKTLEQTLATGLEQTLELSGSLRCRRGASGHFRPDPGQALGREAVSAGSFDSRPHDQVWGM